MMLELTPEQKRELTERIAKWKGPLEHTFEDTYDGSYCSKCMNPGWDENMEEFCDPIFYLESRDDWALVEDEIERRGLKEKYIKALQSRFMSEDIANDLDQGHFMSLDKMLWKIRRASPLVCVQAWDEMEKEMKNGN